MKKILLISLFSFLLSACFWNKKEEEIPQLWAWQKVINYEIPTPNGVLVWDAQTVTKEINAQLSQAKKDLIKTQLSWNAKKELEIKKNISFLESKKTEIAQSNKTSSWELILQTQKQTKKVEPQPPLKDVEELKKSFKVNEQKIIAELSDTEQETLLKFVNDRQTKSQNNEWSWDLKKIVMQKNKELIDAMKWENTENQIKLKAEIKLLKQIMRNSHISRSNRNIPY